MQVDRVTFLWLTASIASGSCAPPSDVQAPAADVADPSAPIVDVGAGAKDPAAAGSPGVLADDDGQATAEGTYITVGEPGQAAEVLSPSRVPDEPPLAKRCRALRAPPGPHCESFQSTPSECETYARALELDAATRATACLERKSGTRAICKFGITADCFLEAIASSPTKPGAKQACRPVVAQCRGNRYAEPDFSLSSCTAAVSAVRDPLRPQLVSCIREGCGIKNCLYAL